MKNIILTLLSFISTTVVFSQIINLSNAESVKEFLDDKKFTVGNYGTITFNYKEYDKDFNRLKFNVIYEVPSQKKPKKIIFETDVMLTWDEFTFPTFVRPIGLTVPGVLYLPNYNIPLFFDLYETGELYYMDKPEFNMQDYIESKINGNFIRLTGPYKLCKQIPEGI